MWPWWPMAAMLRSYRNGVEVDALPCRGVVRQTAYKILGIGGYTDEFGTRSSSFLPVAWNGRIDELAIFNHALSAKQVRQLYLGINTTPKTAAGRKKP